MSCSHTNETSAHTYVHACDLRALRNRIPQVHFVGNDHFFPSVTFGFVHVNQESPSSASAVTFRRSVKSRFNALAGNCHTMKIRTVNDHNGCHFSDALLLWQISWNQVFHLGVIFQIRNSKGATSRYCADGLEQTLSPMRKDYRQKSAVKLSKSLTA